MWAASLAFFYWVSILITSLVWSNPLFNNKNKSWFLYTPFMYSVCRTYYIQFDSKLNKMKNKHILQNRSPFLGLSPRVSWISSRIPSPTIIIFFRRFLHYFSWFSYWFELETNLLVTSETYTQPPRINLNFLFR